MQNVKLIKPYLNPISEKSVIFELWTIERFRNQGETYKKNMRKNNILCENIQKHLEII